MFQPTNVSPLTSRDGTMQVAKLWNCYLFENLQRVMLCLNAAFKCLFVRWQTSWLLFVHIYVHRVGTWSCCVCCKSQLQNTPIVPTHKHFQVTTIQQSNVLQIQQPNTPHINKSNTPTKLISTIQSSNLWNLPPPSAVGLEVWFHVFCYFWCSELWVCGLLYAWKCSSFHVLIIEHVQVIFVGFHLAFPLECSMSGFCFIYFGWT